MRWLVPNSTLPFATHWTSFTDLACLPRVTRWSSGPSVGVRVRGQRCQRSIAGPGNYRHYMSNEVLDNENRR
ncbi:MAG: hypothetical protein ACI8Y4_005171 [Candidatus Poriferisodalaceae bacterium]|jgi:hypothetical protein